MVKSALFVVGETGYFDGLFDHCTCPSELSKGINREGGGGRG